MSIELDIPRTTIRDRLFSLKIKGYPDPNDKRSVKTLYYSYNDFLKVKESFNTNHIKKGHTVVKEVIHVDIPDVLYVHTTWYVYESKLNYLNSF
jgi:hypothetical protein